MNKKETNRILKTLERAFKEVKLIREGKLPKQSIKEALKKGK